MEWATVAAQNIPLMLCGLFYAVLCVFSVVTGALYMSGKRELNPVELSDAMMERLSDPADRAAFAKRMGGVTIVVGIVQGLTAFSILKAGGPVPYGIALGFTIFSICSVTYKLKGRVSAFAGAKLVLYFAILVTLLSEGSRVLFM